MQPEAAAARFLECLQLEYAHKHIESRALFPGMLSTPFRSQSEWYGLKPVPAEKGAPFKKLQRRLSSCEEQAQLKVIGWRERSIDLADRFCRDSMIVRCCKIGLRIA